MTSEEIRLECLKLGHRADREAAEIVRRAEDFEAYVMGNKLAPPVKKPGPAKKPGTQDPFKD